MKVKLIGWALDIESFEKTLVHRLIEYITARKINIVKKGSADITIVYPYFIHTELTTKKRIIEKYLKKKIISLEGLLNLDPNRDKVVVISHENLDRINWYEFGQLLLQSNFPRMTSWPKSIDENGIRFPYWYNYVDWNELPPIGRYERFGLYYKPEDLLSPLSPLSSSNRLNRIVAVTSHLDHPRQSVIEHLSKVLPVDVYGGVGEKLQTNKIELLRKYRFNLVTENSIGYGYETEKVPEAWISGCIPIGYISSPLGDFDRDVLTYDDIDNQNALIKPLLNISQLDLEPIIKYLAEKLSL